MISRRTIVAGGGLAVASSQTGTVLAAVTTDFAPSGAGKLKALAERLNKTRRRRDFKSVPMILTSPDQWDHEALAEVISYGGGPKQIWDHTEIAGPWLNLMRNSLNAQVWSFEESGFSLRLGYARFGASGSLRSSHMGQVSARRPDRRQIQNQHVDRAAEARLPPIRRTSKMQKECFHRRITPSRR